MDDLEKLVAAEVERRSDANRVAAEAAERAAAQQRLEDAWLSICANENPDQADDPDAAATAWAEGYAGRMVAFINVVNETRGAEIAEAIDTADQDVQVAFDFLRAGCQRPRRCRLAHGTVPTTILDDDVPIAEVARPVLGEETPAVADRPLPPRENRPAVKPVTDTLVTIAEVADAVHRTRKSMTRFVQEWPDPVVEAAGSRPGKWSGRQLHPVLLKQFPNRT
ncbi:MAG: hypothetical protein R3B90_16140 [Planctomycetaceae bacterium]